MSAGCDCTDAFEPCEGEKRQKRDMFIQGLCPNLSDLPEKTLCCTLDQTGTAKPLNSATGSAELGKRTPIY